MDHSPENRVIRPDLDPSLGGLYASLIAGGLMLAYAIYYVTVVNVNDDYSFLTLGVVTGTIALSIIGMHEYFRREHGTDRPENPIEEYGGATAVLMGTLSVVWLSRFAVFYAGPEKGLVEYQDGDVWMPVWLSLLQTLLVIGVMEVSTRMIQRHSLGTLPRTVVVLAPLSLVYSGVSIWLDYSRWDLEGFVTTSVLLSTTSAILYSLRLGRAVLYLASSGLAVALPIYMVSLDLGDIEFASLLVPIAIVVGITATDRSLSRKMIENGSGVVVAAILFCQIIASSEESSFALAGVFEIQHPFGLTFWLWLGLLVGWFAPTTMQRTPAMPIGLALALALLVDEAALVAWAVGIAAFIYLETRPHARDWVVRFTFFAMIASWWISAFVTGSNELDNWSCTDLPGGGEICRYSDPYIIAKIGDFSLEAVQASSLLLFPALLILGMWAQHRGRLGFSIAPAILLIMASINIPLMVVSNDIVSVIIIVASLYQLQLFLSSDQDHGNMPKYALGAMFVAPIVISNAIQVLDDPATLTIFHRTLPLASAASIYVICQLNRRPGQNLMLRFELTAILLLILMFLGVNLYEFSEYGLKELSSNQRVMLTLFCLGLVSTILAIEGGALSETTPLEKLVGMAYLLPAAMISSNLLIWEEASFISLVLRDFIVAIAPLAVHLRTKEIPDQSDEARAIGSTTLLALLLVGLTDVSGGLLALSLFAVSVQRASKHVNTPVLVLLPLFALIYPNWFRWRDGAGTIWDILSMIPYLGETAYLDPFSTPRWACLLLFSIPAAVSYYMPADKAREEGPRYGNEQLFGPIAAALLGVSVLLPDVRIAPIVIVTALTLVAWRGGVVNWFYLNPLASLWAFHSIISYLNDTRFFESSDYQIMGEYSFIAAGIVSFSQYFLFENGKLLENFEDESKDKHDLLGISSRAFGYLFILFTGGISYLLPFLSSLLIGWDGLRKGFPALVKISIFMQWAILSQFLFEDLGEDPEIALLWPIIMGIAMISLSWQRKDPYGGHSKKLILQDIEDFDSERDLGVFGSVFIAIPMLPFSEYIDFEASFGFSLVLLSTHHVMLGFGRDESWRRALSLVGMPLGLILAGYTYGGLPMVLMLFLAALTLIGQAVLYASRGGLDLGSTIEGEGPIFSSVGTPSSIAKEEELQTEVEWGPEEERETETASQDPQGMPIETTSEKTPLFSSDKVQFGIRLDPNMIANLDSLISSDNTIDFNKWSPVLGISTNGAIVLNWESNEEE